jgi:hypothetical protein
MYAVEENVCLLFCCGCIYAQSGVPTTNSQKCQKSTELGSLVIGTGARSEEAAASNLVGLRESSV